MFAANYFPDRYFAPRYWPKVGAVLTPLIGRANLSASSVDNASLSPAPIEGVSVAVVNRETEVLP